MDNHFTDYCCTCKKDTVQRPLASIYDEEYGVIHRWVCTECGTEDADK